MPGKLFALIEEIVMNLILYSEGMQGGPKAQVLAQLINEKLVTVVLQERSLENILNAINLLRFVSLMQPPESVALSATSLELLSQLIVSSQSVIAEDYSDAPDDQKDWMRLVCASLATILLTQDGNAQASTLVQTILGNDA